MQVILELPDDLAEQLAGGRDLSRAALEALILEAYRSHQLSEHQAATALGLSRYELDGFLKSHEVWLDYSEADLNREVALGEQVWRDANPGK